MSETLLHPSSARKTLVFCPIGLGNFIMATPALEFLSRELGRDDLHILALKDSIAAMARESGYFRQVYEWDPDGEGLVKGVSVLRAVRAEKFDHALLFFPSAHWKFGLFARMAGIGRRIGFEYPHAPLARRLQNISLPLDVNAHDTHQNLRLVENFLGRSFSGTPKLGFPIPPAHAREEELKTRPYFLCHPGSSAERGMAGKRLPPRQFGYLIRQIHREFGLQCILAGGPQEWMLREQIKRLAPDALLDVESHSLAELAALARHACFYLGNDSGLMHVAVAAGKRCIAFFGPTDERRTGPYGYWLLSDGQPLHLILRRRDLDCAPCWTIHTVSNNPPCRYGDHRCLTEFPVESAWPDIRRWIDSLTGTAVGAASPPATN